MDSLRLDRLASQVVAWHNSHRWARRITVADVTSVGYVVLPFAPVQGAMAASSAAPALQPVPESPPTLAAGPMAEPIAEPTDAPAPTAPAAVAESDEPIEVLIDAPDIDLGTVRGRGPEAAGVEPLPQAAAGTSVEASAETSADAPVDIAFDETLSSAAATAPEATPPQPEMVATAEASAAAQPAATADLGQGTTLRERAMARAQQMTQEVAQVSAVERSPTSEAAPAVVPTGAPLKTPSPAAPVSASAAAASAPAVPASAADPRPIFSEDFIPPLRPADVAEFALRHGATYASPGKDGLVRVVKPDSGMVYPVVEQRWLLTAQIDIGGQRTRLLVGAGLTPEVMGARLSRLPRLAMLAGPPLVVATAAGLWWLWPAAPHGVAKPAAPTPALGVEQAASAASPTTSTPPAAQTSASAPADVEPTLGRVELPSLGPIVDERRRAAAAAAEARAASAATAGIEQAQKSVPPPAVIGPAFAVSTRLLRTRTESEQLAEAMRALLVGTAAPGLQVQALRSGEDWRVVVWPFTEQAQAEKARALLAARGMKVAVIDF